jgi:hypothetical protein
MPSRYRRLGDTLARLVRNCPSIESESGCSLPRNTGRTTWDRKSQVPSSPRTHSLIISAIRHGEGARCTGGGPFARNRLSAATRRAWRSKPANSNNLPG